MSPAEPLPMLWVVGPGRLGLALGLALHRAGAVERFHFLGRAAEPPDHPLLAGPDAPAGYGRFPDPAAPRPDAVLVAVPDGAIAPVAGALAEQALRKGTPVLHASGVLGVDALGAAAAAGLATGSIHPLVAVSDPLSGADGLRGAWYAVEGAPPARALAERWVAGLEGRTLPVREGDKPVYHAAAVFASNYVVALLSVAVRLLEEAGVPPGQARAAAASLARGAVEGVEQLGPEGALTGPVSRGDGGTVAAHLGRLSAEDAALYSVLARETLALARRRGLPADVAARLERLLEGAG